MTLLQLLKKKKQPQSRQCTSCFQIEIISSCNIRIIYLSKLNFGQVSKVQQVQCTYSKVKILKFHDDTLRSWLLIRYFVSSSLFMTNRLFFTFSNFQSVLPIYVAWMSRYQFIFIIGMYKFSIKFTVIRFHDSDLLEL